MLVSNFFGRHGDHDQGRTLPLALAHRCGADPQCRRRTWRRWLEEGISECLLEIDEVCERRGRWEGLELRLRRYLGLGVPGARAKLAGDRARVGGDDTESSRIGHRQS